MTEPELTLRLRAERPEQVAVRMSWRNLLFLHFAIEPALVQPLLPSGLSVDTFPDADGVEMAWIGLVPFEMRGVRPRLAPPLLGCTDFPETNVRTYCHLAGRDPGVWFFSLDAANPFACAFARRFYALPYREARMSVTPFDGGIRYESRRWREPHGLTAITAEYGGPAAAAEPGTLEFFLVERYLLYSYRNRVLYKGQVYHPPYQLQSVRSFAGETGLIQANALPARQFTHALYSPGVDVVAGPIRRAI